MASIVQCSNCGTIMRTLNNGQEEFMMSLEDWGKLGDACYCNKCISTWKDRNNKSFEECGGKIFGENKQYNILRASEMEELITVPECRKLRETVNTLTVAPLITKGEYVRLMVVINDILKRMEKEDG